jgi:hypothetical protein
MQIQRMGFSTPNNLKSTIVPTIHLNNSWKMVLLSLWLKGIVAVSGWPRLTTRIWMKFPVVAWAQR